MFFYKLYKIKYYIHRAIALYNIYHINKYCIKFINKKEINMILVDNYFVLLNTCTHLFIALRSYLSLITWSIE